MEPWTRLGLLWDRFVPESGGPGHSLILARAAGLE